MKKLWITVMAFAIIVLTACGTQKMTDSNNGFVAAPETVKSQTVSENRVSDANDKNDSKDDLSNMVRDPDYDFDIEKMVPSDFGNFFEKSYKCSVSEYALLSGDAYENKVTVIESENPGPVIYIVAGVHGDEEAAWQTGKLLKNITVKCGTVYIIAPANRWGAEKVPKSRYVDGKDLNRSFPGNSGGNAAERVADAIYRDIIDKNPDFVLDLHEATVVEDDRDYLGSSLIFTDIDLFGDLFFDIVWATEDGTICSRSFDYYSPAPSGSINRTVSENLKIPVMTVETFRGYQMEERISDQLDIVQYVFEYYEMY